MLTTDKLSLLLKKAAGIDQFNFFELPVAEEPFAQITAVLDRNGVDARNFVDMYDDTMGSYDKFGEPGETTWTPSNNLMDLSWDEFLNRILSISHTLTEGPLKDNPISPTISINNNMNIAIRAIHNIQNQVKALPQSNIRMQLYKALSRAEDELINVTTHMPEVKADSFDF